MRIIQPCSCEHGRAVCNRHLSRGGMVTRERWPLSHPSPLQPLLPPLNPWAWWESWPWHHKSRKLALPPINGSTWESSPYVMPAIHNGAHPVPCRCRCGSSDPQGMKAGEVVPLLAHHCNEQTYTAGELTLVVRTRESWWSDQLELPRPGTRVMCWPTPTSITYVISRIMKGTSPSRPKATGSPHQRARAP